MDLSEQDLYLRTEKTEVWNGEEWIDLLAE